MSTVTNGQTCADHAATSTTRAWSCTTRSSCTRSRAGARATSRSTSRPRHRPPEQGLRHGHRPQGTRRSAQLRGISLPLLIRFTDILRHRIGEIHEAFRTPSPSTSTRAATAASTRSRSTSSGTSSRRSQLRQAVQLRPGGRLQARTAGGPGADRRHDTPIICNGFKDDEFIEMVMLARKIGRNIIPVVEKFTELGLIVEVREKLGVRPPIGVRVKLAARGSGRWQRRAASARSSA